MQPTLSKMRVDTHFHVFQAHQAVSGARYVPAYSAVLSDWFSQAHSVGVTHGVWVQPSFLGTDNRWMLAGLRAHPEHLRGVAVVSPHVEAVQLQALHDQGVRGIRLNLAGVSHDIAPWAKAHALWDALQALGWHVEVHADPGALPEVLAQLPMDVPLVVDHMGKPLQATASDPTVLAVQRRAQRASTHIKLSGAYRLHGVNAVALAHVWRQTLGDKALLWGSDWPCTNHEPLADYGALFHALQTWVEPLSLDQVLMHNPLKLYWGFSGENGV